MSWSPSDSCWESFGSSSPPLCCSAVKAPYRRQMRRYSGWIPKKQPCRRSLRWGHAPGFVSACCVTAWMWHKVKGSGQFLRSGTLSVSLSSISQVMSEDLVPEKMREDYMDGESLTSVCVQSFRERWWNKILLSGALEADGRQHPTQTDSKPWCSSDACLQRRWKGTEEPVEDGPVTAHVPSKSKRDRLDELKVRTAQWM